MCNSMPKKRYDFEPSHLDTRPHLQQKPKQEVTFSVNEAAGSSSYEVFDESPEEKDESSVTSVDEDDEQWSGLGHDGTADSPDPRRKGTVPKKPPTGEELRTIKDAAELYMSSSFKLQVSMPVFA